MTTFLPCFIVHKNGTAQDSIASNTLTTVTWPYEASDVGNYFASNAWTPPAGKVWLAARTFHQGTFAAGNLSQIQIIKDGSLLYDAQRRSVANNTILFTSAIDVADGNNAYTIKILQVTTSGTFSISGDATGTNFCGHWLGTVGATISQKHFRFRIDTDAVDATPTWGAAEDVGQ